MLRWFNRLHMILSTSISIAPGIILGNLSYVTPASSGWLPSTGYCSLMFFLTRTTLHRCHIPAPASFRCLHELWHILDLFKGVTEVKLRGSGSMHQLLLLGHEAATLKEEGAGVVTATTL
jgi:hypothetical protein